MDRYALVRYGRFWAVYDPAGGLVCVTVYKKGAAEVVRRLSPSEHSGKTALQPESAEVSPAPRAVRSRATRGYDPRQ